MDCINQMTDSHSVNNVKLVSFPDVCQYVRGLTYNKAQEVDSSITDAHKVLRANNITLESNTLNFEDVKRVSREVVVKDTQWLRNGDILMCASSGSQEHVGKVAYISDDLDYTFGGFMAVIRCNAEVLPRYMFHVLASGIFTGHLKEALKSNTIKTINATAMNTFHFPLPPIETQEEIVQVLDEYFEKNSQLIEALDTELNSRKAQYNYYTDTLFNNPVWNAYPLDELCTRITDGSHSSPTSADSGYYMPSVKDMRTNGFDYSNCKMISADDYAALVRLGCRPQKNDVLIAKDGATMLKHSFVVDGNDDIVVLSSIAIFSPDISKILPNYLAYYFRQEHFKKKTIKKYSSGNGVPRIVLKSFKKIPIYLPPIEEQERIISVVTAYEKHHIDLCDSIRAEILLRQSQYEFYRDKLLAFQGTT